MSNNAKYIKDVSIIHNLNFNSDHKMVRAKLTGTKIKTKRQFRTDNSSILCTGNITQLISNLQKEINKKSIYQLPIQEQYAKLISLLKTETKKVNTDSKKVISDETYQLLKERKELLQKKEKKNYRPKISELSKKINVNIRKDKKIKRQNTLKKHIEKTGGIKKAIKELNSKKEWMLKVKTMDNKAFDSLEHDYIWEALRIQGIQGKYIKLLQNIYSKSTARVRLETTGEEFPIERGVRQGDPISPKLFSAALEIIFRNLQWDHEGLDIDGVKLNHLRFADDIILFSECPKQLEQMLQQLSDQSAIAGLTINTAKTKIMTNTSQSYNIRVNAQEIEYVEEYVYLGQLVAARDTMHKEIDRRISNTWKRYWSLSEIMKNEDMPLKEKRKVYNICILPCLTYGCQTWALTEKLMNKVNVCQNGIERSVIGVKRLDKITLEEIKYITKFKEAKKTCKTLKWRWTGHMIRDTNEKWTKMITEWYPRNGKRNKGRQMKRWEDDLKKVAGPVWMRIARDRSMWKKLEEAYVEGQAV
ncbi:uncharacterized protein LOC123667789 [Melitaea cinxia]|uniref:uncharacterized protein LOC123667789 n=1 Tax=Melitaea cinxia TaxID=113334 RepID=UPI001E26FC00|nr:uncharacterized protein LOC123667789 [Melitaea cinxia]